jgi:hypothetical protein
MTTRHPYFDLTLHTEAELAAVLGSEVVARETLAEWPLSCVQRIRAADGGTRIYKAQIEPTVEPEFYAVARSPTIVAATALPNPPGPPALLLEDVAAARLANLHIAPQDALNVADAVLEAIAGIGGDPLVARGPPAVLGLPVTADLTTSTGYHDFAESMLADLSALMESGAFRQVNEETAATVARAAAQSRHAGSRNAYLHGDLRAENVFVRNTIFATCDFIIVDWQRPLWGPVDLDRACLLESLGADPLPVVGPEIMALLALTRIAWLAACARRWFPPGVRTYDAQIVALAADLQKV